MANSKLDSTTIFKAIDVLVNKRIDDLDLDKTVVATIDSYLGKEGAHRVKYNGGFFTAYAQTDTIYQPKTSVYVQIPQNNFSNRKIILGLASSYYVGNNVQAVSSAINNYSVIGANVLQWGSLNVKQQYEKYGFGLNSYSAGTPYQDSWILYDRANETKEPFYKLDITKLNTYIKEAKAVMLSADFRTILPQEQQRQSQAEYGLIFNLAFKNKDTVYTTNKELFEAVADNVKAWSSSGNVFLSMKELREHWVESDLNSISNLTNLQTALVADASEITNFLNVNKNNFTEQEYNIFDSYRFLITDLSISTFSNKTALVTYYNNWFNQSLQLLEASNNEPTKIISYVLDSSRMLGNPFLFNEFTNQYAIFPIETDFQYIDKIVFYCKGFIEDYTGWQFTDKNRIKMYDPYDSHSSGNDVYRGKDIWVKNLQFLALKEISSEYGDYKISVETPQGAIFYSINELEKLTLVSKVRYKEWNNFTDNCTFYWFRKDSRVSSTQDPRYHYYGGIGWNLINNGLSDSKNNTIEIKASDNKAYENIYLCAAVYDDGSGNPVILKEKITIYNEVCKREIVIESNIGTKFKFDVGTPTLTCLIDGQSKHFDSVYPDNKFIFYWSKRTSAGNVFTFTRTYEDIVQEINQTVDYNTRLSLQRTANQLQGVSYPSGIHGNQIVYPVKNINDNSEIYFDCQVFLDDGISTYCIGNAEILLYNEGIPTLNEYTVVIDNGDQVFQYSESGVSPLFADVVTPTNFRHTEPIEIKELKAHLYDPNGIEVNSGTYKVQWQYPITNTLILPPEGLYENVITKNYDMIDGLTTTFSIAESFDYQCTNNQIKCIIKYGSTSYSTYTNFFFGKIGDNGTNGTDIVAQIVVTNDNTKVLHKEPLTVFEYKDGNTVKHKWNIDNNSTTVVNPILQINLYNRSTLIDSSQLSNIKWEVLGGTSVKTSHWTLTPVTNKPYQIQVEYESDLENNDYHNLIIKASAKLKNLNQTYYCCYPICIVKTTQNWNALQAELYNANGNNNLYIDKTLYLKQILYNSDGRNPLYDKNQGVFIHGLKKRYTTWAIAGGLGQVWNTTNNSIPFKITKDKNDINGSNRIVGTTDIDGVYIIPNNIYNGISCDNRLEITTYSSQQVVNKIISIENNIKTQTNNYNNQIEQIDEKIKDIKIEYTRKLRDLNKTYTNNKNDILNDNSLSETTKKSRLKTLEQQYETNKQTNDNWQTTQINQQELNRTTITNTYNQTISNLRSSVNTLSLDKITFMVPIYMALNTFGLASLNAWDGNHIDINENGGYIVAPQIGAGEKDGNNKFTGIVMGSMSQYGNANSDIGLLGLSQGRQSIFLDSKTGNAYFGLQTEDKFGSIGTNSYNEGRIELKPGGISKIGGWRLGQRALYYTSSGNIGNKYNKDYVPNKNGVIAEGRLYNQHHEKDIKWDESGILIHSGDNPYISIKGRQLHPDPGGEDFDTLSGNADSYILENDSLELQLDPKTPTLFTIFRHNGTLRTKKDGTTLYPVGSRTFLAGINSKGQLVANGLQDMSYSPSGGETVTNFGVSILPAFGEFPETASHIGLKTSSGDNNIAKIFTTHDDYSNITPLYITGGTSRTNEYERPISIHGTNISLYASKSASTETSTTSKILLNDDTRATITGFYAGNTDHYLHIPLSGTLTINHTGSSNNGYIDIGGSHKLKVGSTYTIQSKGLTVDSGAAAWSIKNSSGTGALTAKSTITSKSGGSQNIYASDETVYLLMNSDRAQLGYQDASGITSGKSALRITPSDGTRLYSSGNMNLYTDHGKINITQNYDNNGIFIDSYNANGSSSGNDAGHVYMRIYPNSGNSLNLTNTDIANISPGTAHQFQLYTHDGAYIQHSWKIMPNYTTWKNSAGWEIKPGIQTTWLKGNTITGTDDVMGGGKSLKSHTHNFSKGVTVNVYDGPYWADDNHPGRANGAVEVTQGTAGGNATIDVYAVSSASASATNGELGEGVFYIAWKGSDEEIHERNFRCSAGQSYSISNPYLSFSFNSISQKAPTVYYSSSVIQDTGYHRSIEGTSSTPN